MWSLPSKVYAALLLPLQIGKSVYWDLVDFNTLPKDRVLRVPKKSQLGEVKQLLADGLGMPADQIRLWTWDERANKTLRPKQIVPAAEDSKMLCDLRDYAEKINEMHKVRSVSMYAYMLLSVWPHTCSMHRHQCTTADGLLRRSTVVQNA